MISKVILTVCLSLCFMLKTYGQINIVPHQNSIERKWIKPEKFQMDWYAERDTQKIQIGRVITEVQIKNKLIFLITEVKMQGRNMEWKDTTIAELESFKPQYHSSYNPNRNIILNFGNVITGFYHDKQSNSRIEISDSVNSKLYFDSNIYPYLIRLLPLKAGFTSIIPIYDYNPKGQTGVIHARIDKVESGVYEDTKKSKVNVWIVSVSDELNPGSKTTSNYYIGKKDRKLYRQEITTNGRRMEMILVN